MLLLLSVLTLLITPLAMLITRLARPRFGYQWLLAVLGSMIAWPMVLLARLNLPQTVALFQWQPASLFHLSPGLLLDEVSWPFAMALATASLALLLTSIARISQDSPTEPGEAALVADWRSWAANVALFGLGMVTVTAANPLTLMLGWVAIDIVELITLLGNMQDAPSSERTVISFAANLSGLPMLMLAGILVWSGGEDLTFASISPQASLYLLLAAGLRLGVLPLQMPFSREMLVRRGLGTALRLVAWASSLVLLVRTASVIEPGNLTLMLLGLTALSALFGAFSWLNAQDEISGRPFWILGVASLAVAAALNGQPAACLAWSITSLLGGGFLFTYWPRHRRLLPLVLLGLLGLTALPFTPAWNGAAIYDLHGASLVQILILLAHLAAQALLIAGFLRHTLSLPPEGEKPALLERWVWLIYPAGLALFALTNLGLGWNSLPPLGSLPWTAWAAGAAATGLGVLAWRFYPRAVPAPGRERINRSWTYILSLSWLYRLLWAVYGVLARLVNLISSALEGQGGFLWTLVILVLLYTFLRR